MIEELLPTTEQYLPYMNIQIILGFQVLHYISYAYRKYKQEASLFGQIGPSLILKTCLTIAYYIVFKKGQYTSNDFVIGHLVLGVIFQIASLLIEKQFAQVVYQFTIMVQFSYFVQQMTKDSILYVCYLTQYGQNLTFAYHLFQMIKNRNSNTFNSIQLKFHLLESLLWIVISLTSEHDLISVGPGILQLFLTLFCIRVLKELKTLRKQKKE